jgi:hypothetical protein
MKLNESESQITVAALQLLDREVAAQLESFLDPAPAAGHEENPAMRATLDRHEHITNLTKKLATVGDHPVDQWEMALAKEGLDRYLELLANSVAEQDFGTDDYLLSPEKRQREAELMLGARLLDRLA